MRQARVEQYRRINNATGLRFIRFLLMVLKFVVSLLIAVLPILPFAVIWGVFSLEETPHLRTSYSYYGSEHNRRYTSCRYWGVHGKVDTMPEGNCPIIALMKKQP